MYPESDHKTEDTLGDFDALFGQLDQASDAVVVNGGYAELMARIASADYRRRCAERRN